MDNKEFRKALDLLETEKGISSAFHNGWQPFNFSEA